jgi:hypothetical protein
LSTVNGALTWRKFFVCCPITPFAYRYFKQAQRHRQSEHLTDISERFLTGIWTGASDTTAISLLRAETVELDRMVVKAFGAPSVIGNGRRGVHGGVIKSPIPVFGSPRFPCLFIHKNSSRTRAEPRVSPERGSRYDRSPLSKYSNAQARFVMYELHRVLCEGLFFAPSTLAKLA